MNRTTFKTIAAAVLAKFKAAMRSAPMQTGRMSGTLLGHLSSHDLAPMRPRA